MNATVVDNQLAALREGSDVIAQRLADLDTTIEAYVAAIRRGHAFLQGGFVRLEQLRATALTAVEAPEKARAVPPDPVPRLVAEPVIKATPSETECGPTESVPKTELPIEVAAVDSPPPVADPKTVGGESEDPGQVTDAHAHGSRLFQGGAVQARPSEPDPGGAEETQPLSEEDERLLARLDPATANMIRVRRRLTGNRRSVRQLLEELGPEARKDDGSAAGGKNKRWWRRGHEQQGG